MTPATTTRLLATAACAAGLALATGSPSLAHPVSAAFTPVPIPEGKLETTTLRQALTSGNLQVALQGRPCACQFVLQGGIEIGKRWFLVGQGTHGLAYSRTSAAIALTAHGRTLLHGRSSGKIRILVWQKGDPKRLKPHRTRKLVVTLPAG